MEQWRDVIGHEAAYMVSDHGRIRRKAGFVKSPRSSTGLRWISEREIRLIPGRGCRFVRLCYRGVIAQRKVHHLVCEAFIGPRPSGLVVNHKNGDSSDNRISNLEYVTQAENNRHAYEVCGKRDTMNRGAQHYNARLSADDVRAIRALRQEGASLGSIARRYGVCHAHVTNIVDRRSWAHI